MTLSFNKESDSLAKPTNNTAILQNALKQQSFGFLKTHVQHFK